MTQIAVADKQAMNALYAGAVATGAKQAGIVDKDLPTNTADAFKDREAYLSTVEEILSEDSKTAFDPNDEILD